MSDKLNPIGSATVYRDSAGNLIIDEDSLRRAEFSGDEFGRGPVGDFLDRRRDVREDRREDRQDRREDRREDREERREARRNDRDERREQRRGRRDHDREWTSTPLGGKATLDKAGVATVTIRPQHDFRGEDITFEGSHESAMVTGIFFGADPVWVNSDGVPATAFSSQSQLRGMLQGNEIRGGLDIKVTATLEDAGVFCVTIMGEKPKRVC